MSFALVGSTGGVSPRRRPALCPTRDGLPDETTARSESFQMLEIPPAVTFYCMIVAFFVFAMILSKVVLEPTQAVLAERAKRTSGALAEATRLQAEARALKDELAATLDRARHAGSAAGEQIRREAEANERQMLEAARGDAARTLEEVRARVATESTAARATLQEQAGSLAQLAAEKILGRAVAA